VKSGVGCSSGFGAADPDPPVHFHPEGRGAQRIFLGQSIEKADKTRTNPFWILGLCRYDPLVDSSVGCGYRAQNHTAHVHHTPLGFLFLPARPGAPWPLALGIPQPSRQKSGVWCRSPTADPSSQQPAASSCQQPDLLWALGKKSRRTCGMWHVV
jgi:hypothetical protein